MLCVRKSSRKHPHDRPTGCGKTEIARRLARLAQSLFRQVEATKFTEVGYVGRDVESIIRDLIEVSLNMLRDDGRKDVQWSRPKPRRNKRLVDALVGEQASADTKANSASGSEMGSWRIRS